MEVIKSNKNLKENVRNQNSKCLNYRKKDKIPTYQVKILIVLMKEGHNAKAKTYTHQKKEIIKKEEEMFHQKKNIIKEAKELPLLKKDNRKEVKELALQEKENIKEAK